MRHLPSFLLLLAGILLTGPAPAQAPPPHGPANPAQSDWDRLSNESRRLEQEREQWQLQSQQRRQNEAERQDMQRQRRNDLDLQRMERNQERRMPQR